MSEEFENSIRKKLQEADIPFDQDAWLKMESLLDAPEDDKPLVAWWWWPIVALLLGLGGWWYMQDGIASNKEKGFTTPAPVVSDNAAATPGHKTTAAQPLVSRKIKGGNPAENKGDIRGGGVTNKTTLSLVTTPNSGRQTRELSPPVSPEKTNKNNVQSNDNIDFLQIKNTSNDYGYTKINKTAGIAINTNLQPTDTTKLYSPGRKEKKWYVGLTLGPDLNVAPSFKYGNIGVNAGVLLHYYFKPKWFVTTGVVYSKKIYRAAPTDYKAQISGSPYDLVRVNADCDVLDVPVNMNYTFLKVKNNTVSATLGLSNYFMLKEKYQYSYENAPTKERTVQNENQHYLAVLNVGALYQHPAGNRLIIGVQPYAKIPLHGVGAGQVKLYSAGISVQLNFTGKRR
ncbi:outer membrane beta-barrel protein [Chitinophaga sp. MM2321]|uniref:outer membrane beta-barrel protein n=1 Tax=Chitinophaga sp. MM2321 TaxID=3137178 RepID=UPI0032D5A90D